MVEKMGHKKIMQVARVEWINEGQPRLSIHEDSIFNEPAGSRQDGDGREKTAPRIAPIFGKAATDRPKTPVTDDLDALFGDDGDMYDATPKVATRTQPIEDVSQKDSLFGGGAVTQSIFGSGKDKPADDEFPTDDLDALMAEEELMRGSSGILSTSEPATLSQNFDDEMEAMRGMDW